MSENNKISVRDFSDLLEEISVRFTSLLDVITECGGDPATLVDDRACIVQCLRVARIIKELAERGELRT